jgi:fatty-acyl-CoA synthase/long-chain acyl-CoA synthetase
VLEIVTITVGDALDRAAEQWGDREGWIFDRERITFRGLRRDADRAAKSLIHLGFAPGDVVATWMSNRPEWLVMQMACAKTGVILMGLNTRFKVEETRYILERGDVRALFFMPHMLSIDFLAILERAFPGLAATVKRGETHSGVPTLRLLVDLDATEQAPNSFAAFLEYGKVTSDGALRERQRLCRPMQPVLMKFTSGSTGFPKGVLVHHLEALYWGASIYDAMGIEEGDAVLNTQPFYHAGGSCGAVTAPLSLGCKVVTPEIYSPESALRLVEREQCKARSGSAAMYLTEMDHPKFRSFNLSSLKAAWCVGPPAVFERIRREMGIPGLIQPFGATEAGGTCSRVADPWEVRSGSCGKPFPGTEVRIFDSVSHQEVPQGSVGEIGFRGWWCMLGYFKQPQEAETREADGWVKTGDLGFLDGAGNLHCVGRIKDTIRPGGENTSAREIEAFLLTHRAVQQVAVFGVPDERLGEVVMAVVEVRKGECLTDLELIEFCRGQIAAFKIPRYVRFTTDWPMTGSGKIQKYVLRERYVNSNGALENGGVIAPSDLNNNP